ncbi:hypothetical protein ACQJBY_043791 [Aegilops geniculata]
MSTGGPASRTTNINRRVDHDENSGLWEKPVRSMKKSRQPIIIRDNHPTLKTQFPGRIICEPPQRIEFAPGADILEGIVRFANRRKSTVCVLSGWGVVGKVTLLQEPTVMLHGRFEILSLSGVLMPPPCPPGANGLTIYLGARQGQVVGGKVGDDLVASENVTVTVTTFSNIDYEPAKEAADPDESPAGMPVAHGLVVHKFYNLSPNLMPKDEDSLKDKQVLKYTTENMENDGTPEPLQDSTLEQVCGNLGGKHKSQKMEIDRTPEPSQDSMLEQVCRNASGKHTSQKMEIDPSPEPSQKSTLEQDERLVLQRTLSAIQDLIKRADWWVHKDVFVHQATIAKDTVYCAEDLLDELDYYELQDKIEGSTFRPGCLESCDIKMKEVKGKLDRLMVLMDLMDTHDVRQLFIDESICQEANLFKEEQAIFGRQKELMELFDLLDFQENSPTSEQVTAAITVPDRDQARPENVSVLPIVGRSGVGKTTLAHNIFREKRVGDHFDLLIWIRVSDGFDEKKLIKKLIQSVAESEMKSDDLSYLQRILTNGFIHHSRRFLLVIDDAQEDICREDCHEWKSFLAPLKCAKSGSMVLVTTRSLKVADHVGTVKPFVLEGLPEGVLWEFFRMHGFGSDNSDCNTVLASIGRSIVSRLNGSPLGAKMLGRLLSLKLDPIYWRNILESELWKLHHEEKEMMFTHEGEEKNSISPALKLSYQYLPFHLKCCLSFSSVYPRGYEFDVETLVDCWVAVGLVLPYGGMLALDVGHGYFQQLVNRSFFQKAPTSSRYIMHDLVYAMAQQISRHECFVINNREDLSRIPTNVRHLSILGDSGLKSSDLESLYMYKTLRSVTCISMDSDIVTTSVAETWFSDLVNIRVLRFISCQLKELPENVGNLIHLRYLDISACDFDKFPDSFWRLYKLEILDARNCKIRDVPKDIIKLVNLQRVRLKDDLIRELGCVPRVGNLVFLQEMPCFDVSDEPGRRIQELKNMNHLRGVLEIGGLCSVMGMVQSAEAELDKKIYLNTLILSWHESIRPEKQNSGQEMEVLEGLRPCSNIKHLEVKFYMGDGLHPSWLHEDVLSSLASLSISSCPNIATLFSEPSRRDGSTSSSTGFRSLTKLCITWCRRLRGLDNFLHPDNLPAIKVVRISNCEDLVSLPTKSLGGFVHLEDLEVSHCWSLDWERSLALPASLKVLKLEACGEFSDSTLGCLRGLVALTSLDLQFCPSIESICTETWSDLVSLQNLKIVCCQGLNSIGGPESIARIKDVDIRHCPKLKELVQPFRRGCYC